MVVWTHMCIVMVNDQEKKVTVNALLQMNVQRYWLIIWQSVKFQFNHKTLNEWIHGQSYHRLKWPDLTVQIIKLSCDQDGTFVSLMSCWNAKYLPMKFWRFDYEQVSPWSYINSGKKRWTIECPKVLLLAQFHTYPWCNTALIYEFE